MIKFNMLDQKISDVIPNFNERDIFLILSACSNRGWIFNNKELAYKTNVSSTISLINEIIKYK